MADGALATGASELGARQRRGWMGRGGCFGGGFRLKPDD